MVGFVEKNSHIGCEKFRIVYVSAKAARMRSYLAANKKLYNKRKYI